MTTSLTYDEHWTRSDKYHNAFLIPEDTVLDKVLQNCAANDLPDIAVSPAQGKLLNLVAKSIGAKRILEVGTLGGYSTIWMARALPQDGELVTCELDEKHAKIAQENVDTAGLSSKVKILQGPAYDSIVKLEPTPIPFDLVFIDADKENNLNYFTEAKRLLRKGGVIIVDNVVRYGKVSDPAIVNETTEGVRNLLRSIQHDEDIEATTIATVGERGFDGFLYAYRK